MQYVGRTKIGWFALFITLFLLSGCLEESNPDALVSDPSGPGSPGSGGDSPPIVLDFSVSATGGVIPLDVQFTATEHSEIAEYSWNFGEGTTAMNS